MAERRTCTLTPTLAAANPQKQPYTHSACTGGKDLAVLGHFYCRESKESTVKAL